jgi:polysaccharide biosynthesis/export protein
LTVRFISRVLGASLQRPIRFPEPEQASWKTLMVRKMQNAKAVCMTVLFILLLASIPSGAQQRTMPVQPAPAGPLPAVSQTAPSTGQNTTPATVPSTYLLGPDDLIMIMGPEMDEIVNKPYRIDPDGYISVPLLGRIKAGGLTLADFESQLNRTAAKYVRDPQLVASVTEFHSQPISVVGAVNQPGAQQLQGRKTLMQVISMVGGFRTDAGNTLSVARELQWGMLPLPGAKTDPTGKYSVAEISIPELLKENNPQLNILIMPNDVITVPVSETVYVVGDVHKAGGFLLGEHKNMTVLQAVAMAEGINTTSDSKHSRIIHHAADASLRSETPVNVKMILAGKADDLPLDGGDILFVPGSISKKAGLRTVEAVIQTATGMAVWGRF